ncbi:MOSC N-terminal beta barrel domain-containing protein [Bordetella sp. LUAb4]|uniref:MOSC N-terminal beta barrel domain-containing protein n=1 Tax=Bordetella sp. LUAb4 TaxID=2843195 RepID=UPI001E4436C8|nr:MOSC N-terminal beta barrel domain-containing protein [Bordetella sp. LUAb4]
MSMPIYHPVAHCGGTDNPQAAPYERRWLLVHSGGQWLTRGICPRLADITVELRFGYLVMRAPGMLRIDIPLDVIEDDDSVREAILVGTRAVDVVDEGELAAAWVSNFAGIPCRLMKVHPEMEPFDWPE